MEAQELEGEAGQDLLQDGQQVGLTQALAGGHDLELGDAVHGVDVVEPLGPVLIPLMDAVDADEAGASVGGGSAALPDGDGIAFRLSPVQAGGLIADLVAQVVQVGNRQGGKPPIAGIAIEGVGALHEALGSGP